jgi:hypothetical protein
MAEEDRRLEELRKCRTRTDVTAFFQKNEGLDRGEWLQDAMYKPKLSYAKKPSTPEEAYDIILQMFLARDWTLKALVDAIPKEALQKYAVLQ